MHKNSHLNLFIQVPFILYIYWFFFLFKFMTSLNFLLIFFYIRVFQVFATCCSVINCQNIVTVHIQATSRRCVTLLYHITQINLFLQLYINVMPSKINNINVNTRTNISIYLFVIFFFSLFHFCFFFYFYRFLSHTNILWSRKNVKDGICRRL